MNQQKAYEYLKKNGSTNIAVLSKELLGDTEKKNLNLIRGYVRRMVKSKHVEVVNYFQRTGNPKEREHKHMTVRAL